MKLLSYSLSGDPNPRPGVISNENLVIGLQEHLGLSWSSSLCDLLESGRLYEIPALMSALPAGVGHNLSDLRIMSPLPRPRSIRDGYAFRQHVLTARNSRGLAMIPEFDNFPVFYFGNPDAVYGCGDVPVMPKHCEKLDFELECACIIGRRGRNIPAKDADNYIAGFSIMNDWSARGLQTEEMKLNLGPAKGKDFATSLGPWLVTPDELQEYRIETATGSQYKLKMEASVNGSCVSEDNMAQMTWSFGSIIERASYGVTLHPGDVIGSGTCGTGCLLELNGTRYRENPWWLKIGDVVCLSITGLGYLENRIIDGRTFTI